MGFKWAGLRLRSVLGCLLSTGTSEPLNRPFTLNDPRTKALLLKPCCLRSHHRFGAWQRRKDIGREGHRCRLRRTWHTVESVETKFFLKERGTCTASCPSSQVWLQGEVSSWGNRRVPSTEASCHSWWRAHFREKIVVKLSLSERKIFFRRFKNIWIHTDIHQTLINTCDRPELRIQQERTALLSRSLLVPNGQRMIVTAIY